MMELHRRVLEHEPATRPASPPALESLRIVRRPVWPPTLLGNRRLPYDVYWCAMASCRCTAYEVFSGGDHVFSAYAVGMSFKFPFMVSGDVQIGDCFTAPAYRGLGIYPAMVETIFKEQVVRPGAAGYLLIDPANEASRRGASKASFTLVGHVRVVRRLGLLKVYVPETTADVQG